LKPGRDYSAQGLGGGKQRTYWTAIAAAPGVHRDDVETGPSRTGTDKLRFRNVTLYSDPPGRAYNTILSGENGSTIVWLDDCRMYNRKGRWDGGGVVFGNRYVGYVTGGITTEMDNGPGGVLVRNHKIHKITSEALTSARTAINVEVRDIIAKMQETQGGNTTGFTISHNHFIDTLEPMGDDATAGDPQFVDPDRLDYHVRASSPAAHSGLPLPCVPADIDGRPRDPRRPTRGCYVCPEPPAK